MILNDGPNEVHLKTALERMTLVTRYMQSLGIFLPSMLTVAILLTLFEELRRNRIDSFGISNLGLLAFCFGVVGMVMALIFEIGYRRGAVLFEEISDELESNHSNLSDLSMMPRIALRNWSRASRPLLAFGPNSGPALYFLLNLSICFFLVSRGRVSL